MFDRFVFNFMFSRTARPVAWRTWDEWRETYQMLYSTTLAEVLLGCARVSAWAIKQDLPVAVEVTAALQRELHAKERNVLALSLAIIRFINGVCEPFKNVNLAVPISTIGASYGIPEFVVTIRHAATHGQMPTFELAAHGARTALEWLRTNYWEAQLNQISAIEEAVKENLLGFLFNGEPAFANMHENEVLSFGVRGLVALVLNKDQRRGKVSAQFQSCVAELLIAMNKKYRHFGAAFAMELAEETARGCAVAGEWLDFLAERELLPVKSVSRILQWADPVLLGGALPMKLLKGLGDGGECGDVSKLKLERKAPAWPPTSIGTMPVQRDSLTLMDDEWAFVEPGEDFGVRDAPRVVKRSEPKEEPVKPREPENLLEIW